VDNVAIEVDDLAQRVNQIATDLRFALHRDFPDPQRRSRAERF